MPTSTIAMTGASASSDRVRRRRRDVIGPGGWYPRGGSGRRLLGSAPVPDPPAQVALDEGVEIAVEDRRGVRGLDAGAEVLDHRVRLEHVAADLVPPPGLDVVAPQPGHLGLALL